MQQYVAIVIEEVYACVRYFTMPTLIEYRGGVNDYTFLDWSSKTHDFHYF